MPKYSENRIAFLKDIFDDADMAQYKFSDPRHSQNREEFAPVFHVVGETE